MVYNELPALIYNGMRHTFFSPIRYEFAVDEYLEVESRTNAANRRALPFAALLWRIPTYSRRWLQRVKYYKINLKLLRRHYRIMGLHNFDCRQFFKASDNVFFLCLKIGSSTISEHGLQNRSQNLMTANLLITQGYQLSSCREILRVLVALELNYSVISME